MSITTASFFKPSSGKWYKDEEFDMNAYFNDPCIKEAIKFAMEDAGLSMEGFIVVVMDPNHKNSHPIMFMPE